MAKLSKIRLLTKVVCLENIIYLHHAKEEFKRAIFLKEMTNNDIKNTKNYRSNFFKLVIAHNYCPSA